MFNRNVSLEGKFKFEIYDKNHKLKSTTDYIDNFITPTGLSYPYTYSFADCFRYLSVGTGTGLNTISGGGTTGLSRPLTGSGYAYIGGGGHSSCSQSYDQLNKYISKGCGFRINNTGIELFRAWRVPEIEDTFFSSGLTLTEYMLTPGRPHTTIWIDTGSGLNTPTGICSCQQFGPSESGNSSSSTIYGHESIDFVSKYSNICNDTKAFTRILKSVLVNVNEYLIVNYSLQVNLNTGLIPFNLSVTRNNPFGYSQNWVRVSGISSIVHPGINLINDGHVTQVSNVYQIDNYVYRAGESFTPPLGNTLEFSCPSKARIAYISNDIYQFLVNNVSGAGITTGAFTPYNSSGKYFSSGVISYRSNWLTETTQDDITIQSTWGSAIEQNNAFTRHLMYPRSEANTLAGRNVYPSPSSFDVSIFYTGISGFRPKHIAPIVGGISTSIDTSLPSTGRTRAIIFSYQYNRPSLEEILPIKAFIMSYQHEAHSGFKYPFLDSVFYPSGASNLPLLNTGSLTFTTGVGELNGSNSSGYSFFDGNNILQLQVKISWSSVCPSGVVGC